MHRPITIAGLLLLFHSAPASAISLDEALARARTAPALTAARMRVGEARARIAGARLRFPSNPVLETEAGRRSGENSGTDYGVAVEQELQLPASRRASIDVADAAVAVAEQTSREVEREFLRQVATAWLRAAEARERVAAAAAGKQLAEEALRIAERRFAAGDVAQLDVNLARTAVARAGSDAKIASAAMRGHAIELQTLLALPDTPSIDGVLTTSLSVPAEALVAAAADRPDLRVIEAELAEADAESRLARTQRRPAFGLRASYSEEENDRILLGGISVTLPLFQRGQEAIAAAAARSARLVAERDALRAAIESELRGASATAAALAEVTADFERAVMPLVEENERLALESYEVGQIGLPDLLAVRREALDTRRAWIEQLVKTRLAEVELRARAGAWQ